jgi:hypothetical protein
MSIPIAAKGYLGIRKEESFGSGGAVVDFQSIFSEDLQITKNYYYGDRIMASPAQIGGRLMNVSVAGSITFPVTPAGPVQWWEAGIGGTSSPYAPARPLKSLVLHVDRETADIYTSGDMVSSLEFSSSQSNPLQCVATIEGKGYQKKTQAAPASFTSGDDPYLHNDAVFEFDDVVNTDITSFSLSINNNLITDLYTTGKERVGIPASKVAVTGSFTKLFQDTDELDKFLSELPAKLEVTYSRGAKSFKLQMDKVLFDSTSSPLSSQTDYVAETFNFTAYIDNTANNVLTLTIV